MKIGLKIKERRNELGWSLRELGERAGVSAGFLSQVENDQVSPSLSSLQSIATAMQVPMFSLLNNTPSSNIVRASERRSFSFADPNISYELLTTDFTRLMMTYRIHMGPHSKRIAQQLARSTEQWMHVLEGKMKIVVNGESYILDQGDTIYYDGDLLEEFSSVSDKDLVIICTITPPVF